MWIIMYDRPVIEVYLFAIVDIIQSDAITFSITFSEAVKNYKYNCISTILYVLILFHYIHVTLF